MHWRVFEADKLRMGWFKCLHSRVSSEMLVQHHLWREGIALHALLSRGGWARKLTGQAKSVHA